jgi:prepilin-type N-terminal cleavage/methylation domain-containing protein
MRLRIRAEKKTAGKGGFTLIEVLFALGILALGGSSLIALFAHNLREAKRAREEIVMNVIQRDVTVRNQLAAFAATTSGLRFFDDLSKWIVADITAYNNTVEAAERRWENIPAYRGYYFWVDAFERGGAPWSDDANTKGLVLYDNQFVDWNGYGWIDLNNNGKMDPGEMFGDGAEGAPKPSHRIFYDSRGMRNYMMRMRGIVAWDLKISDAATVKAKILNGENIAKYHIFYFTIYNPDTQKH